MGLPAPMYLVPHAGGNEIGRIPNGSLRKYIFDVFKYLQDLLSGTVIVCGHASYPVSCGVILIIHLSLKKPGLV